MKLIEVKGLAAASGSILLTPNERRVAEDRPDCYWWTMAGGGWGEAENVREAAGLRGTSDLGLRLGLIEVRRRVGAALGGAEFGVRADAAWAELRTAEGGESIDNLTTAVHQQQVGAEVSRPVRLGDLALQTFGEAHLRRAGGAGQVGRGLEVAGGLLLDNSAFELRDQAKANRAMEGGTGHYMAMMSRPVTGAAGVAFLPGRASFSLPHASTIAHEFAHNMKLQHAPCGTSGDQSFPYLDGSIGA